MTRIDLGIHGDSFAGSNLAVNFLHRVVPADVSGRVGKEIPNAFGRSTN